MTDVIIVKEKLWLLIFNGFQSEENGTFIVLAPNPLHFLKQRNQYIFKLNIQLI